MSVRGILLGVVEGVRTWGRGIAEIYRMQDRILPGEYTTAPPHRASRRYAPHEQQRAGFNPARGKEPRAL